MTQSESRPDSTASMVSACAWRKALKPQKRLSAASAAGLPAAAMASRTGAGGALLDWRRRRGAPVTRSSSAPGLLASALACSL
jgi:hypothetical protein